MGKRLAALPGVDGHGGTDRRHHGWAVCEQGVGRGAGALGAGWASPSAGGLMPAAALDGHPPMVKTNVPGVCAGRRGGAGGRGELRSAEERA